MSQKCNKARLKNAFFILFKYKSIHFSISSRVHLLYFLYPGGQSSARQYMYVLLYWELINNVGKK